MKPLTLFLLGGGIVTLIVLSKKSSSSSSNGDTKTASFDYLDETPVNEESDELPEGDKQVDDQEKQELEKPVPNADPSKPAIVPGVLGKKQNIVPVPKIPIPDPVNPIIPWNKPQGVGKIKDVPYIPPAPKPGIGLQVGGFGLNEKPWQKFVIKSIPTPGYYYTVKPSDFGTPPSGSRPAESFDPLFHIVKQAYNRQAYTDLANASIARDINNHPYNKRFRHITDPLFNPTQKLDLSKKYGTIEEQYNNPENGSYRNYNLYDAFFPTIFIPA